MDYNVRQMNVINSKDKNILCLASAGSGKTATLTERVRRILEDGAKPSSIVCFTFTNNAAEEMKSRLGEKANGVFIGTIHSYACHVCSLNSISCLDLIKKEKFDEMIERALTIPWEKYPFIDYLFVDEFQDTSPTQYRFITRIPAVNRFYVGDERQCQPAGTKVLLRNNVIKNIEDIEVGDSVVWYDNNKSYLSSINTNHSSIEKKVLKTASRDFCNDNLIKIITESGRETQYTPNHITYVKIHQSEYNHAVYLMCDENNRFRIGKIPFTCTNKSGVNPWRDKMYKEGCQKIWILKVFKTDQEARLLETKLSYKYQIPQTCWQTDKVSWSKEDIDYIYEELDTFSSAKKCLKEFNRDYDYPLLNKATEESNHIHFAKNAVTEIFASNIMPEVMDVIVYDNTTKHKKKYEQIIKIEYQYISSPIKVYSLEVEGGTYVADEIVTHNCIYGFQGSSDEFIYELASDARFKKYYLVDDYRNPPNVVRFADNFLNSQQKLSPQTHCVKTEDSFLDTNCSVDDAIEEITWTKDWSNWHVLCRTNAQIELVSKKLEMREIPYVVVRRGDYNNSELNDVLNSDKVKIMTIHGSKGLSLNKVIVVGGQVFNAEERRICYVAATRAEDSLYWCPMKSRGGGRYNGKSKTNGKSNPFKAKTITF